MNYRQVQKLKFGTALAVLFSASMLAATPAYSASVSGSYQGVINTDSGLGLIGQNLQVDFTYDDSVAHTGTIYNGPNLYSASYNSFLQSMTVSIGANSWTWDSLNGSDYLKLYDNSVIVYSVGVEDRLTLFSYAFTGPDLTGNGAYDYAFSLYLSDNTPSSNPDALTGYATLPTEAPDPGLFNTPSFLNTMEFSFRTGDPELGDYYLIGTESVSLATPVPEPEVHALMLAGLGLVGLAIRRAKKG